MSTNATIAPPADEPIAREDRSILLCCPEPAYRDYIAASLHANGFKIHHAPGSEQAISRLTVRTYTAVLLFEALDGCAGVADNPLLHYLAALPTDERRQTFIGVLGQTFATQDDVLAYALSVNLLVHLQDVTRIGEIVSASLDEHLEADRNFITVLREHSVA